MAYNDDALKAKLSTLNETQESIVSVSQWIAFHRRYADRIAQVWLTRLKDSPPPKRLNYVYLVNDIVQNARARKRNEFPNAFAPIIAEAVQHTYRSSPGDIQNKIKRLLEVWKNRHVFEDSILAAVQARIDDVDKTKASSGKKTLMGNSLFSSASGSGLPKELESLGPLQTAVNKAVFNSKPLVETALTESDKINDKSIARPSAPVHAANLSSLIKKLAAAEASLTETVNARKGLIANLRKLLDVNEAALSKDEAVLLDLSTKRTAEEANKRDVEDSIMRGLAESQEEADDNVPNESRPDVEELTPEPELTTPPTDFHVSRNPNLQGILAGFDTSDDTALSFPTAQPNVHPAAIPSTNGSGPSSSKKRKLSHDPYMSHESTVPDLGEMGVTGYDGSAETIPFGSAFNKESDLPLESPSLTTTLEQDVDALIRSNGRG